jgi:hypothetical protein
MFLGSFLPATLAVEYPPLLQSAAWSSAETEDTRAIAWGDWDQDGDLDLAVGNYGQPNHVYENEGGMLFLDPPNDLGWSSDEADLTTSVAWGDWNSDGDLDLAVGNDGEPNHVYDNDGGTLTLTWSSTETDNTTSLSWGAIEGSTFYLAVGNYGQVNRIYGSWGAGMSLDFSLDDPENTTSIAWGDWDGDETLDLAVGNDGQPNRVYYNYYWWCDCFGDYRSTSEAENTSSVDWGDWDNDGDLDLAAGRLARTNVLENHGGGVLSPEFSTPDGSNDDDAWSVAWGDWDGDGDLELATGNSLQPNSVYENDGPPVLPVAWEGGGLDETRSVAWADWDDDGDLDLAVGNYGQPVRVYQKSGGTLTLDWSASLAEDTTGVAWGDWDGDHDLDLAVGNYEFADRVYENTGGALELNPPGGLGWSSSEIEPTSCIAWGDWDNDGDLDLAVGNDDEYEPYVSVYENDSESGTLNLAWSSSEDGQAYSIAWGDWDGDGDLDLALGGYKSSVFYLKVHENTGAGLNSLPAWTEDHRANALAWGDWDGDGDLELAVGNTGSTTAVYEKTGGSMSVVWESSETEDTYDVAWGDWDNDGDLDLATGDDFGVLVYVNKGGDMETGWRSPITGPPEDAESVAWGDWDQDGDLDLAVGNSYVAPTTPSRVYENGTVRRTARLPETPSYPFPVQRPGTTAAGPAHSSAERLGSPIAIKYDLFDDQRDIVFKIDPEYSPTGGGQWLPATQGAGGSATHDLPTYCIGPPPACPERPYTFMWDAAADDACGENVRFRISVRWQAPELIGQPLQRARMATVTPPFRLACQGWYPDTDGDGYGAGPPEGWHLAPPPGYADNDDDCDDTSDTTFPGAAENDSATDCMKDADGDGYGDPSLTGPFVPGNDCDDSNPFCYTDCTDGDGDLYCEPLDCAPGDPNINPGIVEDCDNEIDDNCNDLTDMEDPQCATGAGRVPSQLLHQGQPMVVALEANGDVTLTWHPSCVLSDNDYAVYEGSFPVFTSHESVTCSTGGATTHTFEPRVDDAYYLVVPRNANWEGSYGTNHQGDERPAAAAGCFTQAIAECE